MNKKGFTLVELLATITILGLLLGIAIPAVARYITKARKQGYETMEKSLYNASESYYADTSNFSSLVGKTCVKIDSDKLIDDGFLEKLNDPKVDAKCSGEVYVYNKASGSNAILDDYHYYVKLTCGGSKYTTNNNGFRVFPENKFVSSLPSGC